jgi:predicted transposase/invertase (TIGR01784 family)
MALLDPKADLTFKRVFGENPDLLIDLLNSILPLEVPLTTLVYLPSELLPIEDGKKLSIVDVRCTDQLGRQFVVEMQVLHVPNLRHRMLYNASKVLAKQLAASGSYGDIKTVYTLCFLENSIFPNTKEWFHHFTINHNSIQDMTMEGMEWLYIELGKWRKLDKFDVGTKKEVWLTYLSQPDKLNHMFTAADEKRFQEVRKALQMIDSSQYTPAQIRGMEKYVDDYMYYRDGFKMLVEQSIEEGRALGMELGIAQGKVEGKAEAQLDMIAIMDELISGGLPDKIAENHQIDISIVHKIQEKLNRF